MLDAWSFGSAWLTKTYQALANTTLAFATHMISAAGFFFASFGMHLKEHRRLLHAVNELKCLHIFRGRHLQYRLVYRKIDSKS